MFELSFKKVTSNIISRDEMGLGSDSKARAKFWFAVNETVSQNYSGPNIRTAFWMALLFLQ